MALRMAEISLKEEAESNRTQLPSKKYIDLDDKPPESLRRSPSPGRGRSGSVNVPVINLPGGDGDSDEEGDGPMINVSPPSVPSMTVSAPAPSINVEVASVDSKPTNRGTPSNYGQERHSGHQQNGQQSNGRGRPQPPPPTNSRATQRQTAAEDQGPPVYRRTGLRCSGCELLIVGRIVSAMNKRWHPFCFKYVFYVLLVGLDVKLIWIWGW